MAKVVVHVYHDRPGTFTLQARQAGAAATITIRDHGRWQPVPRSSLLSGRGLPLIHPLAGHATIETRAGGTTVTMAWTRVSRTSGRLPAIREPDDRADPTGDARSPDGAAPRSACR